MLDSLSGEASRSTRQRANHNIHPRLEDPVQRFFNAMQSGTYVRPHRYVTPSRWEFFLALRGRLLVLVFDDEGVVTDRYNPASP